MQGEIEKVVDEIVLLLTTYGLDVVGAIVICAAGLWLAGWARHGTSRALAKTGKVDETLQSFLGSAAKYFVVAFTALAARLSSAATPA